MDYTEALVGAHYDYRFHRNFSTRAGYRYLWAVSERGNEERYPEHRIVGELTPYDMVELGYDSRCDEFNRVRLQVGAEYQFHQRLWLDVAFFRQWDDRSSVPLLNALGIAVIVAWCKWCRVTAPAPADTEGT